MTGACAPKQFRGYDQELAGPLDSSVGHLRRLRWRQTFRQWVRVCTINDPVPAGDYLVQVRTNVRLGANPAGPADQHDTGRWPQPLRRAGRLREPRRAPTPRANGISIFGNASMSIYVNAPSARTPSSTWRGCRRAPARHTCCRSTSSTSPTRSRPGTLANHRSARCDHRLGGPSVTFANCTGIGPAAGALPTCSVTHRRRLQRHDGRPSRCRSPRTTSATTSTPKGCWVRIEYDFASKHHRAGHHDLDGCRSKATRCAWSSRRHFGRHPGLKIDGGRRRTIRRRPSSPRQVADGAPTQPLNADGRSGDHFRSKLPLRRRVTVGHGSGGARPPSPVVSLAGGARR